MAAPSTREVLRFCFFRDGLADRVAVLSAWCLALAIFFFDALFRLLLTDGNLLIRVASTLISLKESVSPRSWYLSLVRDTSLASWPAREQGIASRLADASPHSSSDGWICWRTSDYQMRKLPLTWSMPSM